MSHGIKLATPEDVRGLLDDPVDRSQLALIDCREEEERNAEGWIAGSRSFPSREFSTSVSFQQLALELAGEKGEKEGLKTPPPPESSSSPPLFVHAVFYCHSSLSRGPRGAKNFLDAQEHLGLSFPSVLVLMGGWSAFHMVYHRSRPDLLSFPWSRTPRCAAVEQEKVEGKEGGEGKRSGWEAKHR